MCKLFGSYKIKKWRFTFGKSPLLRGLVFLLCCIRKSLQVSTTLNLFNNSSPINNVNQINDTALLNVVRKIKSDFDKNSLEFLKEVYPNLTESKSFRLSKSTDYLCAATLLLVYVSLCQKSELNGIRELMTTKLDNSIQVNIVETLKKLQQHEEFFCLSYNTIKHEILSEIFVNFVEKHSRQNSLIGDGVLTPVKHNLSDSISRSPLQEFFQTPKRSQNRKSAYSMCGDGDHIKKIESLTNLLNEEELEKASLQEQLNIQMQKCYEFEAKLRCKVEEINLLKLEWENESKKNEAEINSLRNNMIKIQDEEKKRISDLCYYEKYVSTLESDIATKDSEFHKLKNQLNLVLNKCNENELQLREATELNLKFQRLIDEKEAALEQFRDIYANFYNEDKTIDVSFVNKSVDESPGENLGIVMDALLREENEALKKTVEETKLERDTLISEIKSLKEKLTLQTSAISELNFLNKELNLKFENVEKTEKELAKVQEELVAANDEIHKLIEENTRINEQYNALNNSLKDLINCEKLKKIFQINFLSLAEEFKAAQKRLEQEILKISKLTTNEKHFHSEKCQDESANELLQFKVFKNLNCEELSQIPEKPFSLDCVINGNEKLNKLVDLLKNFENCQAEWSESKIQMEKTCNQINFSIISLQDKIRELENSVKQSVKEKMEIQNNLKRAEEKVSKIETNNASEIQKLQDELETKERKMKEFESLIEQSKQVQEALIAEREMLKEKVFTSSKENRNIHGGESDRKLQEIKSNVTFCKNLESPRRDQQEFDDSLEEVPVTSKTFDIVSLDDRTISDRTFSIRNDGQSSRENNKTNSTWVISPPHKNLVKVPTKESVRKQVQGECWIIPLNSDKASDNKTKKVSSSVNDLRIKTEDLKITELQKEILTLTKECECLKFSLIESEQKRKKEREAYERNYNSIRQSITTKYENQLEHLKNEMKHLYTKEMAKQTSEKNSLIVELEEQNKRDKERIDDLINQLWDLREKLLQEQALRRDLERNYSELKEKYENLLMHRDVDEKSFLGSDMSRPKNSSNEEVPRLNAFSQLTNTAFPTIPTEDEDEIFDNRFLEDMKTGVCKTERPEERLKELQYRNSLCLPHLKSSYPGETQFHNPGLFKENDLKFGHFQFGQESQSLTDSDHSMTRSLLPDTKGKKKEQTSYRKPGPPTPSKNGGRLSIQSGDLRLTPRNVLKDLYESNDRNKGTPNPLKIFRSGKSLKTAGSVGVKDENTAPVTPRKKIKFFRKPFGARDQ